MFICESESFIKSVLIGFKINSSFNEAILNEELSALLAIHGFSDLDSYLAKFLIIAISLSDSESIFPHVMGSEHIHSDLPCSTLDVVMLCLF